MVIQTMVIQTMGHDHGHLNHGHPDPRCLGVILTLQSISLNVRVDLFSQCICCLQTGREDMGLSMTILMALCIYSGNSLKVLLLTRNVCGVRTRSAVVGPRKDTAFPGPGHGMSRTVIEEAAVALSREQLDMRRPHHPTSAAAGASVWVAGSGVRSPAFQPPVARITGSSMEVHNSKEYGLPSTHTINIVSLSL